MGHSGSDMCDDFISLDTYLTMVQSSHDICYAWGVVRNLKECTLYLDALFKLLGMPIDLWAILYASVKSATRVHGASFLVHGTHKPYFSFVAFCFFRNFLPLYYNLYSLFFS